MKRDSNEQQPQSSVDGLPINEYYEEYLEEYDDGSVDAAEAEDDGADAEEPALPRERTICRSFSGILRNPHPR